MSTPARIELVGYPRFGRGRWPLPPADVRPTTIQGHLYGMYRHAAALAGMQLDVFSPLAEGPMTAEGLADALGLDAARLRRLLDAVVVSGLLIRRGDRYENTAEAARYLVRSRDGYLGGAHEVYADLWQAALMSADSVRAGRPMAAHDLRQMSQTNLTAFLRGHHGAALHAGRALAKELDLDRGRQLLEVGAGSAGLAIAACRSCPALRATAVELAEVTPITQRFVDEAGMVDRVRVRACDIVSDRPEGLFDVAVLRNVLQGLGPEAAEAAIRNVVAVLRPGASLHILGWMREERDSGPDDAILHDMLFLNLYEEGRAHPVDIVAGWLEAAGCIEVASRPAPRGSAGPGAALLSATRP